MPHTRPFTTRKIADFGFVYPNDFTGEHDARHISPLVGTPGCRHTIGVAPVWHFIDVHGSLPPALSSLRCSSVQSSGNASYRLLRLFSSRCPDAVTSHHIPWNGLSTRLGIRRVLQSRIIPRRAAIVIACVRSLAPSFSRMCFM